MLLLDQFILDFLQVLTDLCREWLLMWLNSSTIFTHPFTSRAEAVGFLEDYMAGRVEASEGVERDATFAKRRKIEDRLLAF